MTATAIDTRLHPLTALRAVRALMANPEDTRQIFVIFKALRGKSGIRTFARFQASAMGRAILADRRVLLNTLNDRAALSQLPDGSMGRAYFTFMERESLTADGLVTAAVDWENEPVSDDVKLFRERMRDAHDLTHILTGYGRDGLGEMCLLAFMNRHSHNLGQLFVIAMNWPRLPQPWRAAIRQAWRNGKKARWFQDLDFEALLPRNLEEVRRELNIPAPTLYQAVSP